MNIVLFGPPGAGKGTQGEVLAKDFNLFKISTGDLLRDEIKKRSSLGNKIKSTIDQGVLVSDDVINNLIESILSNEKYGGMKVSTIVKRKQPLESMSRLSKYLY